MLDQGRVDDRVHVVTSSDGVSGLWSQVDLCATVSAVTDVAGEQIFSPTSTHRRSVDDRADGDHQPRQKHYVDGRVHEASATSRAAISDSGIVDGALIRGDSNHSKSQDQRSTRTTRAPAINIASVRFSTVEQSR